MFRNPTPFIALHLAGIQASAGDLASLEQCRAAIAAKAPNDQTRLSLPLVDAIGNLPGGSTPLSPNY